MGVHDGDRDPPTTAVGAGGASIATGLGGMLQVDGVNSDIERLSKEDPLSSSEANAIDEDPREKHCVSLSLHSGCELSKADAPMYNASWGR